ncbi:MAG: 4Fe-4S ferredoxin, partial [Gammaproteobacteria bacterium]
MPRLPPIRLRAAEIDDTLPDAERREILIAMAASVALAGAGCARTPDEAIVAAQTAREYGPPGEPLFYATNFVRDGYAHGVLVETAEGRPIKVEGNPRHPASLGATDVFAQASVLQLWDPDRSQAPLRNGAPASWAAFETELQPRLDRFDRDRGAGLAVLTGATT